MYKAIVMCCVYSLSLPGYVRATEIDIVVTDIDTTRGGAVYVLIFGEEGFPIEHDKALQIKKSKVVNEKQVFHFGIEKEEIAIKVLHDEDDNGRVTKDWTGVFPGEGLGFSNGQRVTLLGPPSYSGSKLTREKFEQGINIPVVYP